jgi:hypothetical protein
MKLDKFTRQYIETALWSSTDESDESGGEPLDANYSASDIAPETVAEMAADCADFQEKYATLLDESGLDSERAGHDFWLSRNGHGSGFFDEGDGLEKLQEAAESYGEYHLYVGDDGLIYGNGPMRTKAGEAREWSPGGTNIAMAPNLARKDWHQWRSDVIDQISSQGKSRTGRRGMDVADAEEIFNRYEEEMKQRYRNREIPRDVAQNALEVWKQDRMSVGNTRVMNEKSGGHWKISRIIDHGPEEHYRFHVEGENLNYPVGDPSRKISWAVPNLDSLEYDVSGAEWTTSTRKSNTKKPGKVKAKKRR